MCMLLAWHTYRERTGTARVFREEATASQSQVLAVRSEEGHKNCDSPKISGEPNGTMKTMIPSKQEQLGHVI